MKYVSAEYIPPTMEGMPGTIKAIGDDGVAYFIPSEDCDVPPWPEYIAEGGTIAASDPTPQNITSAPDDLTGGPTIAEVFNVHD